MPFNELSRLTASGKTFFFNRDQTAGGADYLTINTIRGKPARYEKLTLLVGQLLPFHQHLTKSIEDLTGLKFAQSAEPVKAEAHLPGACPACQYGPAAYRTRVGETEWSVYCDNCGHVLLELTNG